MPTLAGEENDDPGCEVLGRLFAIGYTMGLMEAVDRLDGRGATAVTDHGSWSGSEAGGFTAGREGARA